MDEEQFKAASRDMTEYITNYITNIRDRRVLPEVEPGYLRPLLPDHAPDTPDEWSDVMADIERVIMPGVTHWHSPQFHAYYPTANTYPSILADMLSDAIGCIGFTWISSPACTELEVVMMDWLGELLGLPQQFLASSGGKGGGVIQGTASEASLVALLAAKTKMVNKLKEKKPDLLKDTITSKLIAYASDQAHSSVERAGLLAGVKMRQVVSNDEFAMRGPALRHAIQQDLKLGLIPFFEVLTMATSVCSFDNLRELGEVTQEFDLWLHVDAAYAGAAMVCEEYRYLMDGVELAQSFNFNPHKWLLVTFDCSAMWVKNANDLVDAFNVDPLYLKHDKQGLAPDYRHWQIPLGRRFRSLKLWFVMRLYGKQGFQAHIRKQIGLAHQFEDYVKADQRFELILPVTLGLVCFRLKKNNEVNEALLKNINSDGVMHLVPSKIRGTFFLRFCVCSELTETYDIEKSWQEVLKQTQRVLQQN
ncbi:aromatic-L-amino-acid decarboxylase-like [Homarus americanus]|uniref:aromatic-L-amino-acid decarboxylase-like n=1 Tax=Homarus americanus TaxID=6706 RepID=UPI001C48AE87|nr:aromatic-L-amino-acid decarboxylase-like [Homarus americanus]